MQDPFEENKVLQKALIIASSSLKEIESKAKKLKEENEALQKSVPSYAHMKLNMPSLLRDALEKLTALRKAAVLNKNLKLSLSSQVQELRENFSSKDSECKAIKKRNQLEKKGSYSQMNMNKKGFVPTSTPRGLKRTTSDSFTF
jgi:predicted RNase H-like nuclease (RuvC/YqgF family)